MARMAPRRRRMVLQKGALEGKLDEVEVNTPSRLHPFVPIPFDINIII